MIQQELQNFHIKNGLVKRNIDKNDEKFLWPDIHHMHFQKCVLGLLFIEQSYGGKRFRLVNTAKRGMTVCDLQNYNLKKLYNSASKIGGKM